MALADDFSFRNEIKTERFARFGRAEGVAEAEGNVMPGVRLFIPSVSFNKDFTSWGATVGTKTAGDGRNRGTFLLNWSRRDLKDDGGRNDSLTGYAEIQFREKDAPYAFGFSVAHVANEGGPHITVPAVNLATTRLVRGLELSATGNYVMLPNTSGWQLDLGAGTSVNFFGRGWDIEGGYTAPSAVVGDYDYYGRVGTAINSRMDIRFKGSRGDVYTVDLVVRF